MDDNYLVMVLYLLAGTAANLPYLVRSTFDCFKSSRPIQSTMPPAAPVLLATALFEFSWVLPCLVQCMLQLFYGYGPWSARTGEPGCDVMGTYSVFASVSAMLSTLFVAYLTFRAAGNRCLILGECQISFRASAVVCVVIMFFAVLVAALPYMGVGAFAYSGAGFCYIDWYNTASATIMLIITLPTILATLAFLVLATRTGGWPSSTDLWLIGLSFLSAWALWVPASFIGLSGSAFPKNYMITGGFLGHAQALINPYVYGLRWRASALQLDNKKNAHQVPLVPGADESAI